MTDDQIANEALWLIAERKGMVQTSTNADGQGTKVIVAERNWLIEAMKALQDVVGNAR